MQREVSSRSSRRAQSCAHCARRRRAAGRTARRLVDRADLLNVDACSPVLTRASRRAARSSSSAPCCARRTAWRARLAAPKLAEPRARSSRTGRERRRGRARRTGLDAFCAVADGGLEAGERVLGEGGRSLRAREREASAGRRSGKGSDRARAKGERDARRDDPSRAGRARGTTSCARG